MRMVEAGSLLPFRDWLDRVLREYSMNPYVGDNHLRPQVEFLVPEVKVFRFEEGIPGIVEKIFAALAIKNLRSVPHLRRGAGGIISCDRATVERVVEFYRADFDQLGYDPEDCGSWFAITTLGGASST